MNLLRNGVWILGVLMLINVIGCGPSREASSNTDNPDVEVTNSSLSLADYLRRVPGVTVQGSGSSATVLVRGVQSANAGNQPLFVIDGARMGRSFSRVIDAVDVNDIDTINVLKGNEASGRYGMQGSAGVIEIRTKRDNN